MTVSTILGPSAISSKRNDFFIGIDSDGCVFDTMEVKHKECFIPNMIQLLPAGGDLQVCARDV